MILRYITKHKDEELITILSEMLKIKKHRLIDPNTHYSETT